MAKEHGPPVELTVSGRTIKVSSPDKPSYPDLGADGTKLHVVEYYAAVGEALLTAIGGRPTYLQRYPEGLAGDEVYQKRLPPHAPDWIDRVHITFPSGRTADAMCPREPATGAWAANYGTLTFHPWPGRCGDPEHPDRLRIDLDPQPGTDFDDARRVALDLLAPVLDELGYEGFPKTSGGRGVHVDVAIEPRWSQHEVRRAALALARELARRDPDLVTAQWWKEDRGARVFVDFNQNARDRTIASAYSLRANSRATASVPITWTELAEVEPDDLTIRTVPARLAAVGDPNALLGSRSFSLQPLLEWVERDEAAGQGEAPFPPNYPKVAGEPPRVQPSRARRTAGDGT
jgi:DNA ligase D-like protein (predicted polymerase)